MRAIASTICECLINLVSGRVVLSVVNSEGAVIKDAVPRLLTVELLLLEILISSLLKPGALVSHCIEVRLEIDIDT